MEASETMPIVVGAHLRAETTDRPLAEQVRETIESWMAAHDVSPPPAPLVCTDLWYLNNAELRAQPTLCIGDPEVNAATAALAGRLPSATVADGQWRIQLDAAFASLTCCVWGVDEATTAEAIEAFVQRWLDPWLGAIFGIRGLADEGSRA